MPLHLAYNFVTIFYQITSLDISQNQNEMVDKYLTPIHVILQEQSFSSSLQEDCLIKVTTHKYAVNK